LRDQLPVLLFRGDVREQLRSHGFVYLAAAISNFVGFLCIIFIVPLGVMKFIIGSESTLTEVVGPILIWVTIGSASLAFVFRRKMEEK